MGFLSSIGSIIGKMTPQSRPFLNPYNDANGYKGKEGVTLGLGNDSIQKSKTPMSEDTKKVIEGITNQIGELGLGLANDSSSSIRQYSPLETKNSSKGIQIPEFQLPAASTFSIQPIETLSSPVKPRDTLMELQSLIERQRAGY